MTEKLKNYDIVSNLYRKSVMLDMRLSLAKAKLESYRKELYDHLTNKDNYKNTDRDTRYDFEKALEDIYKVLTKEY